MYDAVIQFIAAVGCASDLIVDAGRGARLTSVIWMTGFRTITKETVVAGAIIRRMADGVCFFVTGVDGAVDAIVGAWWGTA